MPDYFTGEDIVFNLQKFNINPAKCKVEYTCTDVSPKGIGSPVCSDFVYDWDFNGVDENGQTDGKLVFAASKEDYDSGKFVPGVYTVTVNGRAIKSDPQ